MGTEITRMQEILNNPPATLAAATHEFLQHHSDALDTLTPLEDTDLKEYYTKVADDNGSAPLCTLLGDISTLSLLSGQSGLLFQDKRRLGVCSLGKNVLLCHFE